MSPFFPRASGATLHQELHNFPTIIVQGAKAKGFFYMGFFTRASFLTLPDGPDGPDAQQKAIAQSGQLALLLLNVSSLVTFYQFFVSFCQFLSVLASPKKSPFSGLLFYLPVSYSLPLSLN